MQPAATVQDGSPPAAAEQLPAIKTQQPAAAASTPHEGMHGAGPHAPAPAAGLQRDSHPQAALAVPQQPSSEPNSGADPVEEGSTASGRDRQLADRVHEGSTFSDFDWQMVPEVSLKTAFVCLNLCTAGLPDSMKGAQACTAGTL